MALSLTERAQKLWDAWSIRGFMIVSLSLQVILNLLAPKRKVQSKGLIIGSIWLAYFLADWFAITTTGFISHRNSSISNGPPSDIRAFWAPFLLLHLGGPDNITSYSLEDNELWKRHLLELLSQVLSIIYVFFKSFSDNELWLASGLVLFAGIIKYLGRTIAFRRASFDNLGKSWVSIPHRSGVVIPEQFERMVEHKSILGTAVLFFSNLKKVLVGPLPREQELDRIKKRINTKGDVEVLQIMEIELSLLYEVLHTKFPVIDSTTGSYFRLANFGCILVALISFSSVKKQYQLELFDILLTYALLIGALALDVLSFRSIMKSSDWFAISRFQDGSRCELPDVVVKRQRWSKTVSQLNFLTYHVKKLDGFIGTLLLRAINNLRCQSSQNFTDSLWSFIFEEIKTKLKEEMPSYVAEVWFSEYELTRLLQDDKNSKLLCYLITRILSDYMFYLAVMKPTMMAGVLDDWEKVFEKTSEQTPSVPIKEILSGLKGKLVEVSVKEEEEDDDDAAAYSDVDEEDLEEEDDDDDAYSGVDEEDLEEEEEEEIKLFSEAVQLACRLQLEDGFGPKHKTMKYFQIIPTNAENLEEE
ncbi:hypothetical protein SLE2022_169370 [Rubroshorea leprosula]